MQPYTKFQDTSLLVLRAMIAAIFLYAGYAKWGMWSMEPNDMLPAPMLNLMKFLSIVEPIGAVAVLAGFLTRWAAAGLSIIMLGAILVMQFMMQTGFVTPAGAGWNFPLMILGGCLILMAFGPGSWSVEGMQKKGVKPL